MEFHSSSPASYSSYHGFSFSLRLISDDSRYSQEGGWEQNIYSGGSYVATQTGNVTYEIQMKWQQSSSLSNGLGYPTNIDLHDFGVANLFY